MIYYAHNKPVIDLNTLPELSIGASGEYVTFLQELLCMNTYFNIEIDGDFGPATQAAVDDYQVIHWIGNAKGMVDLQVWRKLLSSFIRLDSIDDIKNNHLTDLARFHIEAKPHEVGGQNLGPWVRYYMRGKEGTSYPWCAGFVSTIVEHFIKLHGINTSYFKYTQSCDELYKNALMYHAVASKPAPGLVFLVKGKTPGDYVHTGFVYKVLDGQNTFMSIEGNTDSKGGREGYEACYRYRKITDKYDFIFIL